MTIAKSILGDEYRDPLPVVPLMQPMVKPLGYLQLSVGDTAVPVDAVAGTCLTMIQTDKDIRYRDDGVAPTASVGMRLLKDATMIYTGDPSLLKLISVVATATVDISHYGIFGSDLTPLVVPL